MKKSYILFIDSGVGGLSTLAETIKVLSANFIYFADNNFMPYGSHSASEIFENLKKIISKLLQEFDIKLVCLACNTATTSAISSLRVAFQNIQFVGTEPAVKLASALQKSRVLCALTPTTAKAPRFLELCKNSSRKIEIYSDENLASVIETALIFPSIKNNYKLQKHLYALISFSLHYDAVVLGCTHYVFLKEKIKKETKLPVFDGNFGVAKQISKLCGTMAQKTTIKFIFSKQIAGIEQKYRKILGQILANQKKLC